MKVLPRNKYGYSTYAIYKDKERTELLPNVIDITETEMEGIRTKKYRFSDDLKSVVLVSYKELKETEDEKLNKQKLKEEYQHKSKRGQFIEAFRKYQASVNYGEVLRSLEVDEFIKALKNKDWSVLSNPPNQLLYFMGMVGFNESGLIEGECNE